MGGLASKASFKFRGTANSLSHTDKSVASYLHQWTKGKTVMPDDWHNQIPNGKITNVHNNGLIVGRKKCDQCMRYRCTHQQFAGGVVEQQKLEFNNT